LGAFVSTVKDLEKLGTAKIGNLETAL